MKRERKQEWRRREDGILRSNQRRLSIAAVGVSGQTKHHMSGQAVKGFRLAADKLQNSTTPTRRRIDSGTSIARSRCFSPSASIAKRTTAAQPWTTLSRPSPEFTASRLGCVAARTTATKHTQTHTHERDKRVEWRNQLQQSPGPQPRPASVLVSGCAHISLAPRISSVCNLQLTCRRRKKHTISCWSSLVNHLYPRLTVAPNPTGAQCHPLTVRMGHLRWRYEQKLSPSAVCCGRCWLSAVSS